MKKTTLMVMFILVLIAGICLDLAPISVPDGIDKVYHFLGYSLITALAISTFISFLGKKALDSFIVFVLMFGGIFAGIFEALQRFVPVRDCDVNDWIVNLLGITIVCVVAFLMNSKEKKHIEINQERFDFKDLPALS